jgi:regulator of cell morphogenesis and NO signaling
MNNTDLIELTEFIIQKYHNPLRENLPKIHLLLNKIVDVHGSIHPEFAKMKDIFILFQNEMLKHLDKEEKILFPMMQALQKAINEKKNI